MKNTMKKSAKRGFTLIELMIVVAIIGILAAVAIPKFADLINKSKEGATKGSLGSIRSALTVYYGDNEGRYPTDDLTTLTANSGKYLQAIPVSKVPGRHADIATVNAGDSTSYVSDGGGWAYLSDSTSSKWGDLLVNCSHADSKGTIWTAY